MDDDLCRGAGKQDLQAFPGEPKVPFNGLIGVGGAGDEDRFVLKFVALCPEQFWRIELGRDPSPPLLGVVQALGALGTKWRFLIGPVVTTLMARQGRGISAHITIAAAVAATAIGIKAESPAIACVFLRAKNAFRLLRLHLKITEESCGRSIKRKKGVGHVFQYSLYLRLVKGPAYFFAMTVMTLMRPLAS